MTARPVASAAVRIGQIGCVCTHPGDGTVPVRGDAWRLSAGFGLSVLTQALALAALPAASRTLAPTRAAEALPYALMLLGAALASVPASLFLESIGRRWAFLIGASFGLAGGMLMGIALSAGAFMPFCVGALWLGLGQGFALFYRHAAAAQTGGDGRAALVVLAGGCAAAVAAPALAVVAQRFAPYADFALAIMAGTASAAALPFVLALPHRLADTDTVTPAVRPRPGSGRRLVALTLSAALSWALMARFMGEAPRALVDCGTSLPAVGAYVSWHMLAMYGPMALAARWTGRPQGTALLGAGLSLQLAAAVAAAVDPGPRLGALLIAGGLGWSLVQVGTSDRLYRDGKIPRLWFGLHDAAILIAALLGALAGAV